MAHAVPSQVVDLVDRLFTDLKSQTSGTQTEPQRRAPLVKALLNMLERIPDELIRLGAEDAATYWANVGALQSAYEDRNRSNHHMAEPSLDRGRHSCLFEIRRLLIQCPDEAPATHTSGLQFIKDLALREALRIDLGAASSALMNHEYKGATVLAGSVVEALLLWGLEQVGEAQVRLKMPTAKTSMNTWGLGDLIVAAHACALITESSRKQAELCQDFRNLIHPGRQARLGATCHRGTALGALSAVEVVAVDLAKKLP